MKKYKVKITKEKVIIKPLPGHEIDQDLICVLNRHYEHNGIFKPIKKELPKTWEEFLRTNKICYPTVNHFRIPLKSSKAFEALAKLIELRDHYNSTEPAIMLYSIYKYGSVIASTNNLDRGPIVLNSTKLGIEFGKNFRELIETAKPLI